MARFAQGVYIPKNAKKYIGKNRPRYRSGWELTFMTFCDSNNHVLYWASESLIVPYRHPFTGKITNYIPDFFVVYQNKHGNQIAEVVEIKPKKQSIIESKVANAKDRMVVAINHAKWQAAMGYCKQHGYTFRVITEDDLFYNGRNR
jgi:hypothetical protein